MFCALTAGCSFGPTGHPRDTAAIPQDAEHLKECSWFGNWGCAMNSLFFGDGSFERRSACMAYIAPSGSRVEQCGSVPVDR
ncbi:MAG: hypothetical protein FJ145_12275 [Deltaproteobacteria bacterium]|nr:hypothetical protein [Deltaproteobacteria bacterium]